jgi:DNA-binding FadR family transcriptional regulator
MMQLRSIRYFIWPPNNQVPKPNVAENVLKAHRKLLELIKNQDAAGAHEFMRDHIEHIRNQHRILRGGGDPEDAACC